MIESTTIARPYAKAAFDFAVEQREVPHWQSMLEFSTAVSLDANIATLFSKGLSGDKLAEIFIKVCGTVLNTPAQNFIRIMANNGRLFILPKVLNYFIYLRDKKELTVKVEVISCSELSDIQLEKISFVLERRLSRRIKLDCKINKSILAGFMIRINGTVIDGTVLNRLNRLSNLIQA